MNAPRLWARSRRLVVGLAGSRLDPAEAAWLRRYRPAGVILFARNVVDAAQLSTLCCELRALLPPGSEIVADHEGGPISVLQAACGRPPAPATLGTVDDADLTHAVHAETGRRLRAVGIDRALAPSADVLTHPRNPVIGSRAFGSDPERVARHVAAAVAGLRAGGAGVCLKHWPGHGGTGEDSHLGTVAPGPSRGGVAFAAGVAAGADAVMLGHLAREGDGPAAGPVTLAAAAVGAARDELAPPAANGEGARDTPPSLRLWTDDITMGALSEALAARGIAPLPAKATRLAGSSQVPGPSLPEGPAPPAEAGLVAPDRLPRAWFAALEAAGCDRWLVRGIPWGAFPLEPGDVEAARECATAAGRTPAVAPRDRAPTDEGGSKSTGRPESAGGTRDADAMTGADAPKGSGPTTTISANAAPYREARERAVPTTWRWRGCAEIAWLDFTADDSWGAVDLLPVLGPVFERVEPLAATLPPDSGWRWPVNVAITSHRPLPPPWRDRLRALRTASRPGSLLTLGHPSLGDELAAALRGTAWRHLHLADATVLDVAPAVAADRF